MTSELKSEAPLDDVARPVEADNVRGAAAAVLHLRLALVFLAVATLLLAASAARLVFPDLLSDVAFLSYGRLFPAAVDLLVYGWLTIGLIGAGYYILPKMSGRPLGRERMAVFSGGLLAAAVLAGTVAVLTGGNEGRQYLEFPIWVDAALVLGVLIVAGVITGHIAGGKGAPLSPSDWYYGAAIVWLLLAHIVGSIPGVRGVNATLQTSFYRGALLGLWLVAAGLGVVYYVASAASGRDPRRITQLGVYGFWSIGFVFAMSAAARLTYTTAPDWLETIGTVFAIGLLVPFAIVTVDLTTMLRAAPGRGAGAYLLAGLAGLGLYTLANIAVGLRSANAIIGMTDWIVALDLLLLLGVFTPWLVALVRQISEPPAPGRFHLVAGMIGVLGAIGALFVSGVQSGLTWIAFANDGEVSAGDAFEATSAGRDGHLWVVFIGVGLFAVAQIWAVARVRFSTAVVASLPDTIAEPEPASSEDGDAQADEAGDAPADDESSDGEPTELDEEMAALGGLPRGIPVSLGRLRTGTLGLFVIVALFLFVLPIVEADHRDATLLAESSRDYESGTLVSEGRDVYIAEGCWYCHTQEVRGIVTDVGLGPVAVPGDYAREEPALTGLVRNGPDLMFAGSRGLDPAFVAGLLEDPRAVRSWSTMPAHDYLSSGDLQAVAAYVSALTEYSFE